MVLQKSFLPLVVTSNRDRINLAIICPEGVFI